MRGVKIAAFPLTPALSQREREQRLYFPEGEGVKAVFPRGRGSKGCISQRERE